VWRLGKTSQRLFEEFVMINKLYVSTGKTN
jgi:hypothetical protein